MFTRALESLEIGTLMGFVYPKQEMFDLNIYSGVMSNDNEKCFKIDVRNLTNFDLRN